MAELQELLPNSKKLSVLIIDPDDTLRMQLAMELQKVYHMVDDAATAYDGLGFCKINRYDIVITDDSLERMSTPLLVQNILNIRKDQHIVLLSSTLDPELLTSLINMSLSAIVPKPLDFEQLYTQLLRINEEVYNYNQMLTQLGFAKKIKAEQKELLQSEAQKREKLIQELAYERKRIGKLMAENAQLAKRAEGESEDIYKVKYLNDITHVENKYALQRALKEKGPKAVVYLNIDHFDLVNTLYGMGTGNKLLKATAERIKQYLPKNAKLYNVTVDEFVVLIDEPTNDQERLLAEQISTMFQELPLEVDRHPFEVIFSIGIVRGEGLQLFVQSKIASKESKYYGGGIITRFDNNSNYMNRQREDLYWIKTIKSALHDNRIIPYYQPIVSNFDNKVEHFEVLCRLQDEHGKIISADKFIKAAEVVGLITRITRLIIDGAFKHFSQNSYRFSINICNYDLYENYLVELLKYKCDLYNIEPNRVFLELVGDNSLDTSNSLLEQIDELRDMGFHIGVDDVSVDYSIFSRMLRLNADFIKIDKSFIRNIGENRAHQEIVETIVEFAKKSGMKTVAEHVESKDELRVLSNLGVDLSQGYYVGKPNSDTTVVRE